MDLEFGQLESRGILPLCEAEDSANTFNGDYQHGDGGALFDAIGCEHVGDNGDLVNCVASLCDGLVEDRVHASDCGQAVAVETSRTSRAHVRRPPKGRRWRRRLLQGQRGCLCQSFRRRLRAKPTWTTSTWTTSTAEAAVRTTQSDA